MKKKRKVRNIIMIIMDIIIGLIVIYFVLGYINFTKISSNKNPLFDMNSYTYKNQNSSDLITVHDYKIYKIVEVKTETPKKAVTYSMKLWFMEDVK